MKLIRLVLSGLGLTCETKFIPWSVSRNKAEKYPSLNYSVTCLKDGKPFLTTDYMMGFAYVPGYGQFDQSAINKACEAGRSPSGSRILPKVEDVYYSLVMDSDVLDFPDFEEWAINLGYDPDSRSAEKIYRTCLDSTLRLRLAVGNDGLDKLRAVFEEY